MKETFLIVGIIAAGIIVMVLLLNNKPDLLSYKSDDRDKQIVTKQEVPDFHLSIVTSEPSFWDKVANLKSDDTAVTTGVTDVSSTDENGNEVTVSTDDEDEDESDNSDNKVTKDNPVTKVPH